MCLLLNIKPCTPVFPQTAPSLDVRRRPLQVPLGSVTPLAIAQPTAAGVALLLDAKLRDQPRIFVHPLDNTATTVLSPAGLEAFIRCGPCPVCTSNVPR